jgi:hypothetical protein
MYYHEGAVHHIMPIKGRPANAGSQYVGEVGIYSYDGEITGLDRREPKIVWQRELYWLCRSNGEVWPEWYVRAPKGPLWRFFHNRPEDSNVVRFNSNPWIEFTIKVPMSETSYQVVNRITKELWTMHKLTSMTLL